MKKQHFKPDTGQHLDYVIFSLSATVEGYRLAFRLNGKLGLQLARKPDLKVMEMGDTKHYELYFFCNDHDTEYYLIEELAAGQQLMNHFFLLVRNFFGESQITHLLEGAANIPEILDINRLMAAQSTSQKASSQKTMDRIQAILVDLENHMADIKREEDKLKVKLQSKPASIKKLYSR
ncbi:MAG: hypothetical protein EOM83_06355 [Clostridia bacterium]|nr:hypothetical protein [Clostridia bacterium]